MPVVEVPLDQITDRASFHKVFAATLGFPKFYGRSMDAWIDCMSDPDFNSGLRAALATPGDVLTLSFSDVAEFQQRCPDLWTSLVDCAAFVNYRSIEAGERPMLVLAYRS